MNDERNDEDVCKLTFRGLKSEILKKAWRDLEADEAKGVVVELGGKETPNSFGWYVSKAAQEIKAERKRCKAAIDSAIKITPITDTSIIEFTEGVPMVVPSENSAALKANSAADSATNSATKKHGRVERARR